MGNAQGDAALLLLLVAHPRITRDIRFGARLAPHPNFSSTLFQKNFVCPNVNSQASEMKKIIFSFHSLYIANKIEKCPQSQNK